MVKKKNPIKDERRTRLTQAQEGSSQNHADLPGAHPALPLLLRVMLGLSQGRSSAHKAGETHTFASRSPKKKASSTHGGIRPQFTLATLMRSKAAASAAARSSAADTSTSFFWGSPSPGGRGGGGGERGSVCVAAASREVVARATGRVGRAGAAAAGRGIWEGAGTSGGGSGGRGGGAECGGAAGTGGSVRGPRGATGRTTKPNPGKPSVKGQEG